MPEAPPQDPALHRFVVALGALYGDRLVRTVLYGSRARGDQRADSDYDVAVFLRDLPDRGAEMRRLAELETGILYDTGALINALPFPAEAWRERNGFMHELRHDGRDL